MRTLLRNLGLRQLAVVGIVVLVAAIVIVGQFLPHDGGTSIVFTHPAPDPSGEVSIIPPLPVPSGTPVAPLLHSPVPPVTTSRATPPQTVAKAFALAWLRGDETPAVWLRGVSKYATGTLAVQLAQTDPANVPATRITGTVKLVNDSTTAVAARVPTDTGTLVLALQRTAGRWLVNEVDWNRA